MKNIKLIALLVCLTVVVCSFASCDMGSVPVIGGLFTKTAAVTFNANGGELVGEPAESYTDNAALALPSAALQYYKFLGWSLVEDGSGELYTTEFPAGFELTDEQVELGVVFYAVWERLTGTITYDLAGGEWAEGEEPVASYEYGEVVELPVPEREFFAFEGWLLGESLVDELPESQEGNVALVAQWVQEYTQINFVLGREGAELPDAEPTFRTDEGVVLSDAEYIPEAPGALFSGWYLDAEFTQPVTEIEANTTEPVTVYAKWADTPVVPGDNWVGVQ